MSKTSKVKSRLEILKVYIPGILVALIAMGIAWRFMEPAPPSSIILATGPEGGSAAWLGERYAEVLKSQGLEVKLLITDGAEENLQLIMDKKADAAFIQGGVEPAGSEGKLFFLASLFFQPVWVFTSVDNPIDDIMGLEGKKLAVGPDGSGTRAIAESLLGRAGIKTKNSLVDDNSPQALLNGDVDLVFVIGSPDSPQVRELLSSEQVHLVSLRRSEGYTKHFLYLSHLVLEEGSVDLAQNLPGDQTDLLACTANLVVGEDFHPALTGVLLGAAREIHSAPSALHKPKRFPSADFGTFPITREARFFHEHGPSFLQGVLPYQVAATVERVIIFILPLLTIVLPLCKILPALYGWRMKSKIYQPYKQLLMLEGRIDEDPPEELRDKLNDLEQSTRALLTMPAGYAAEVQDLRVHIRRLRAKLPILNQIDSNPD